MGIKTREFIDSDNGAWRVATGRDGSVTITSNGVTMMTKAAGATSPLVITGSTPPSRGAGASAAETYDASVGRTGGIITTRIVIDLTGLVASTTDLDIIGNTGGAASAHFGQFTALLNGTFTGGQVTCLEVPAGGPADIDFYSATESTGAQDALVTSLTETALITAGGAWTSGLSKGMTALPAANEYLYLANGAAGSPATYTAGKFLIELLGH